MNNKLYKCPDCSNVHIGEEWDKKTQDFTGSNRIVHIAKGEFGIFYVCPNCGSQIDWDKIEIIDKEKCNYCEGEVDDRTHLLEITTDYWDFNIYIDGNNNLTHDDMFEDNKINYCPICGRRL